MCLLAQVPQVYQWYNQKADLYNGPNMEQDSWCSNESSLNDIVFLASPVCIYFNLFFCYYCCEVTLFWLIEKHVFKEENIYFIWLKGYMLSDCRFLPVDLCDSEIGILAVVYKQLVRHFTALFVSLLIAVFCFKHLSAKTLLYWNETNFSHDLWVQQNFFWRVY